MSFKQFFKESIIDDLGRVGSVRPMTEDELINIGMTHEDQDFAQDLDFNKGWVLTSKSSKEEKYFIIYWLPSYKSGDNSLGLTFYKPFPGAKYCNVSGPVYRGSETAKVIEDWEFRNSITPDTLNTFGDML